MLKKLHAASLAAVLIFACGGQAMSQETPNQIPNIETKPIGTNESQNDSGKANEQVPKTTVPLNVVVSGDLNIKTDKKNNKANNESSKWTDPLTLFTAA